MRDAAVLRPDPAGALEATYRNVQATRMAGLTFLNPALAVEAVGFAPWKAHWLGVVVTPWFMNLVVAPRDASQWKSLPPGEKRRYRFPAGDYDFVSASEEGVGEFFVCSLFSPVLEFDDQPTARYVAEQALAALLDPANDERAAERPRSARSRRDRSRRSRRPWTRRCPGASCCVAGSCRGPMSLEGSLVVRVAWDGRVVRDASVRSTRPLAMPRVLDGRAPDDAAAMVPRLFSVCAHAQGSAAASALASAQGEPSANEVLDARSLAVALEAIA